jgi:hypothetical protein
MDHIPDKPEDIDRILREVYEQTAPQDSWQALRERIDATLSRQDEHATAVTGRSSSATWPCGARLPGAATGLLFYVVATNRRAVSLPVTGTPALLTHAQIEPLVQAFSQARGLFADHQLWLMLDSIGNSQIGLTPNDASVPRPEEIIVLRLMLREGDSPAGRYADRGGVPRQRITRHANGAGSTIELHLTPSLREDGRVDSTLWPRATAPHGSGFTPVGRTLYTSGTGKSAGTT